MRHLKDHLDVGSTFKMCQVCVSQQTLSLQLNFANSVNVKVDLLNFFKDSFFEKF